MPNLLLQRYLQEEELGRGSFGKLVKASDIKNNGRPVAIKIVSVYCLTVIVKKIPNQQRKIYERDESSQKADSRQVTGVSNSVRLWTRQKQLLLGDATAWGDLENTPQESKAKEIFHKNHCDDGPPTSNHFGITNTNIVNASQSSPQHRDGLQRL